MGITVITPSNPVVNAGNVPSMQAGLFANRPVSATANAIYVADDTQQIFQYVSGAWVLVASVGGGGGLTGANNGLSVTGSNAQLGGALTQATTITAGAFQLLIDVLTLGQLTINSTTAAFLPPRMTNAQMLAIVSPSAGMLVYNTTNSGLYLYTTSWAAVKPPVPVTGANGGLQVVSGNVRLGGSNLAGNAIASLMGFDYQLYSSSNGPQLELFDGASPFALLGVNTTNSGAAQTFLKLFAHGGGGVTLVDQDAIGNMLQLQLDNLQGIISNSLPAGSGLQDAADYSANWNALNYMTFGYFRANAAIKSDTRNSANFGQTGSLANVGSFTNPASDNTFRVGCWLNLNAITAGTITMRVAFTDNDGTARTLTFFAQGTTVAAASVAGYYAFPTMDFRVKASTIITVSATFAGTSTLYDAGCTITRINGF